MGNQDVLNELKGQISAIESGSPARFSQGANRPRKKRRSNGVDASTKDDALKKIIALVNVSDRSEHAIRERLGREGFSVDEIENAIARAKELSFIDDDRFAAVLIRSRLSQGKGVCGIERELRDQGIDIELVEGWPDEFDVNESTEKDRALALLKSKPPRSKNLREGAYRKLVGKGYSSSVAASAARQWFENVTS